MKKFIITIDTEGDNLWKWKEGEDITTNNVQFLQRFQDLCNKFSFKPVWLSNWEMINDDNFVEFIKRNQENCELGMHLHAWNTPPFYELPKFSKSGAPYLIEYPSDVMEEKIKNITKLFAEKFGYVPQTHRAGRWAVNDVYFKLLRKYGYKIDCSVTPKINWKKSYGQTLGFAGPDYTKEKQEISFHEGIMEVPVTVKRTHRIILPDSFSMYNLLLAVYYSIINKPVWLRPNGNNLNRLKWLVDYVEGSEQEYLMFMLHSSELMPGGSPTFKDDKDIEKLYVDLESLFEYVSKKYEGTDLKTIRENENL